MNRIKGFITVSFLIVIISGVFAQGQEQKESPLIKYHKEWTNREIDSNSFIAMLKVVENDLMQSESTDKSSFQLAEIYLIYGEIYLDLKEEELSISSLEKAILLTEESLKEFQISEQYRLMASAGSYLMMQKGLSFKIRYSSIVYAQTEKALELDPDNSKASLIKAQYLLNAPRIAGGNKQIGMKILIEQSNKNNLEKLDQFHLLIALSEAYQKQRDKRKSIEAVKQALTLFPNNQYALNLLEDI